MDPRIGKGVSIVIANSLVRIVSIKSLRYLMNRIIDHFVNMGLCIIQIIIAGFVNSRFHKSGFISLKYLKKMTLSGDK